MATPDSLTSSILPKQLEAVFLYHVLTAAVEQEHFCMAGAVDGVASIVHHSHHTSSRLSWLPPAPLSNMPNVCGERENAVARCLASHLDVMSHLGKLSE